MDKIPTGIRGETDRRILDRMLIMKQISPAELKEYTDLLPDVSDNAEEMVVEISDEGAEDSHDD